MRLNVEAEPDRAPLRRVLVGVVEEIADDLLEASRVTFHGDRLIRQRDAQGLVLGVETMREVVHRLTRDRAEVGELRRFQGEWPSTVRR